MFGSKINHSDLQKLEEENKNLTHKIEKFQSENLELKNKITSLEQAALESKLKTDLLNVLLTGVLKNITIIQGDMLENVNKAEVISSYSKTSLAEMDELNHIVLILSMPLWEILQNQPIKQEMLQEHCIEV